MQKLVLRRFLVLVNYSVLIFSFISACLRVSASNIQSICSFPYLAKELKKLWNMKLTVIQIVIGALGTITKVLIRGAGWVRYQRMSREHPKYSILRLDKILRWVLETLKDLLSIRVLWKTISKLWWEKLYYYYYYFTLFKFFFTSALTSGLSLVSDRKYPQGFFSTF